jgi:hypothetical protein
MAMTNSNCTRMSISPKSNNMLWNLKDLILESLARLKSWNFTSFSFWEIDIKKNLKISLKKLVYWNSERGTKTDRLLWRLSGRVLVKRLLFIIVVVVLWTRLDVVVTVVWWMVRRLETKLKSSQNTDTKWLNQQQT